MNIVPQKPNEVTPQSSGYNAAPLSATVHINADNSSASPNQARNRAFQRHDALRFVMQTYRDANGEKPFVRDVTDKTGKTYQRWHKSYYCRSALIPGQDAEIVLRQNGDDRKASYKGLRVCDNPNCSLCAPARGNREAYVVAAAIGKAVEQGYSAALVTFTLSHHKGDSTESVLDLLQAAWKRFTGGRAWTRFKQDYELLPIVKRLDTTYSDENGYHLHYHAAFLYKGDDLEVKEFLLHRWLHCVELVGGKADVKGFDFRRGDTAVSEYILKWGKEPENDRWGVHDEIVRSDVKQAKGGDSIPQLLDKLVDAKKHRARLLDVSGAPSADVDNALEMANKAVYRLVGILGQYYAALRGRRVIEGVWRLAEALGLDLDELKQQAKDAQQAQIEALGDEESVLQFDAEFFSSVMRQKMRAELLNAAERGKGGAALRRMVLKRGNVPQVESSPKMPENATGGENDAPEQEGQQLTLFEPAPENPAGFSETAYSQSFSQTYGSEKYERNRKVSGTIGRGNPLPAFNGHKSPGT